MEIKVNRINTANAEASTFISSSKIDEIIENLAKDAAKTVSIPGFRKGKVPTSVIKTRFKDRLKEDAYNQALRELLQESVKLLEIPEDSIIGEPVVSKFEEKDDGINVEIKISTKPKIELDGYKDIIPKAEIEVSQKEIDERIELLAKSKAPNIEVTEDRGLQKDDYATIDFEGSINQIPINGTKERDLVIHIGSNLLVDGFEDQLIGMKKGESREIEVTFPNDYKAKELAGKKVKFNVTLKKIETKEAPKIDDNLAKTLLPDEKEATLELLKQKVKEQLELEKKNKLYNEELKPKILEELANRFEIDLPDVVVEQEIELNFRNALANMNQAELNAIKDDKEKLKELRESHREIAKKSVKVTFMIDALARLEGIDVSNDELVRSIYIEAISNGLDPKQTFEHYKQNGLLPAIKMAIMEDKLLTHLLDKKLRGEL